MAQNFFDEPYVVMTILNRALTDKSPNYGSFNHQVALAAEKGVNTTALEFGALYAGATDDQLSTLLLGNLGLLPNPGLQASLGEYLVSVGKANVGIVALQLGQILSGLEHATGDLAVFNAAAVAWNKELVASYAYSLDPNWGMSAPDTGNERTGVTLFLTSGDDLLSPTAPEAKFKTTDLNDTILATTAGWLSVSDAIDGGAGMDTLTATLGAGTSLAPLLRNIEKVVIAAGAGAEFGVAGIPSLQQVWLGPSSGDATFFEVDLATTVGVQNSSTGSTLTVKFAGASGPSDTGNIAIANSRGQSEIVVAAIETLRVTSTGGNSFQPNHARITAPDAQKIIIGGDGALTATVTGSHVSVIDASALIQGLDLKLSTTSGVAVAINTLAARKITLGAGGDTLAITGLASPAAKDIDLGTSAALAASTIEVSEFVSGTDVVRLSSYVATSKAAPGAKELASIASAASLLDATALAATTAGASKAIAFRFGADTYILLNDSVAALGANDSLIKLTGVAALADASWTSA